jgi:coenzyme F420-0:L-glutamate ligase/coenzyme F420-1:gamma-L-glutamate ligase
MFGYGAREAVLHALGGDPGHRVGFGSPATATELADALEALLGQRPVADEDAGAEVLLLTPGDEREAWVVGVAAYACGWQVSRASPGGPGVPVRLRKSPALP